MTDQAEKLRKIMNTFSDTDIHNINFEKKAKIISVTSGKGGVGKTNFSINLAISLKQLGYEVVVIDGDIGLANVDIISGIVSKYTISDLFISDKDIFQIMTEGPKGIKIISGGSGIKDLTLLNDENLNKLINEIEKLEKYSDFVIIDTGAGISNTVIKFLMTSDEIVLIVTPDPTSLTDGYALLKALKINNYKKTIKIVVNMVQSNKEAEEVFKKLNAVSKKFLMTEVDFLGYINNSSVISNSIKEQKPFILGSPNSTASKKINIIALNIVNGKIANVQKNKTFSQRLREFFLGEDG